VLIEFRNVIDFLCPLSEVVPAEGGWLIIRAHKLVKRVDTLHIVHKTESKVFRDIRGAIHPASDSVHEGLNLLLGALGY